MLPTSSKTQRTVITRSRPSLSCLPCRRRKVKCDKQHPICNSCVKASIECSFGGDSGPPTPTGVKRRLNDHPEDRRGSEDHVSKSDDSSRTVSIHQGHAFHIGQNGRSARELITTVSLPVANARSAHGHVSKDFERPKSVNRGHFHVGNGNRTRFVENTFWASVKGFVSTYDYENSEQRSDSVGLLSGRIGSQLR